jgi:hypothetical protein
MLDDGVAVKTGGSSGCATLQLNFESSSAMARRAAESDITISAIVHSPYPITEGFRVAQRRTSV